MLNSYLYHIPTVLQIHHLALNYYSTVYTLLSTLDVRKSVGSDRTSARFLKEIAGIIADSLTKLFNKSLQSGAFPVSGKDVAGS